MKYRTDIEILRSFFSSYFHEDWSLDASEPGAIVDRYLTSNPASEHLSRLARSLESLAADGGSDSDIERALFRELGCYYMPSADGLSARKWLTELALRFTRSARA
ncbi:MAG: hypothetical protein IT459_15685 [Planctomycetes bacterium]|nr:hypothetical protein [Planctomycetota bacterium]